MTRFLGRSFAFVIALLPVVVAPRVEAAGPEMAVPRVRLDEAVRRALARNPTAVNAEIEVRRAKALVEEARAASLPLLNGVGTYTRLDSDRTLQSGSGATTSQAVNAVNGSLNLSAPLIHPRAWTRWSEAKDAVDVARMNAADVRRAIAVATARAYLTVIVEKRLRDVSISARETARAHFDYAHQRVQGGVGNRLDEVRAAQEVATDEAQVAQSEVGVTRAQEALGVIVGADGPLDVDERSSLGTPPVLPEALREGEVRSDVQVAKERLKAAEHAVDDHWTDFSPYLVLVGSAFYQNPPTLTLPMTGWQAQLVLTLPIYDGGLRYGQQKERRALRDEADVTLAATVRQARSDVRAAMVALQQADHALVAARDAATRAREALELATIAYRAGTTTNLEVIDAERTARDADLQAAIAEDTARQARLDLLAASGRMP